MRSSITPSEHVDALAAEKQLTANLQVRNSVFNFVQLHYFSAVQRLLDERDHQVMALSQTLREKNEELAVLRSNKAMVAQVRNPER